MRTKLVVAGGLILALCASSACGGSASPAGPSGPSGTQGLSGTWRATRAEFVNASNSSVRTEIVARGASLLLVLDASGAYTRTLTAPGDPPDVQTGTWSASRDVLTLRPSGVTFSIEFDYAMSGSVLNVSEGHVEFDFDDNGSMEQAILGASLTRQ